MTSAEEAAADDALVVSMKHDSTWDKFGTRLRDMPFLRNFFGSQTEGRGITHECWQT